MRVEEISNNITIDEQHLHAAAQRLMLDGKSRGEVQKQLRTANATVMTLKHELASLIAKEKLDKDKDHNPAVDKLQMEVDDSNDLASKANEQINTDKQKVEELKTQIETDSTQMSSDDSEIGHMQQQRENEEKDAFEVSAFR